jgi:hypothetical protein
MNPEQIRLECLKLVNRHDWPPDMVVERAKVFERYVQDSQAPAKAGRPTKANNPLA